MTPSDRPSKTYGANVAIQRAYKPLLDELGITYPQYLALSSLWENDAQTVGAIARRLDLEPSTITPILKRLEQAGFVKSERRASDERHRPAHSRWPADAGALDVPPEASLLFEVAGMTPARLLSLVSEVKAFRDAVTRYNAA